MMNKNRYPQESGSMTINGSKMEWIFRRTKGEGAFGIRASRIYQLELKKNGNLVAEYDLGWSKKISDDDEESALCLTYLIDRYGHERVKTKKK